MYEIIFDYITSQEPMYLILVLALNHSHIIFCTQTLYLFIYSNTQTL